MSVGNENLYETADSRPRMQTDRYPNSYRDLKEDFEGSVRLKREQAARFAESLKEQIREQRIRQASVVAEAITEKKEIKEAQSGFIPIKLLNYGSQPLIPRQISRIAGFGKLSQQPKIQIDVNDKSPFIHSTIPTPRQGFSVSTSPPPNHQYNNPDFTPTISDYTFKPQTNYFGPASTKPVHNYRKPRMIRDIDQIFKLKSAVSDSTSGGTPSQVAPKRSIDPVIKMEDESFDNISIS